MKCITCGNELLEGDCICSQCGSYIESTQTDNQSDNPSVYDSPYQTENSSIYNSPYHAENSLIYNSPYQSTTAEGSDSYQNPYKTTTGAEYIIKHANKKPLPTYTIERIMISIIAALCLYSFFVDFIKYDTLTDFGFGSHTSTESFKLFEFIQPASNFLMFTFITLFGIFSRKKALALLSMILQTVFTVYLLTFINDLSEIQRTLNSKSKLPIARVTKIRPGEGYSIIIILLVLLLILLSIEVIQLIRSQPSKYKYE